MRLPRYVIVVLLLAVAGCDEPAEPSSPASGSSRQTATGPVATAPTNPPKPSGNGPSTPNATTSGSAAPTGTRPAAPAASATAASKQTTVSNATVATAEGDSAEVIAKRFCEHLNAGRGREAGAMLYFVATAPKIWVDRELGTVNNLSTAGGSGQSHFTLVDIRTQGVAAVAVVNADKKLGQPTTDYDPVYLVKINGQWWLVPHLNNIKYAHPLVSQEEFAAFTDLEQWFRTRKSDLAQK